MLGSEESRRVIERVRETGETLEKKETAEAGEGGKGRKQKAGKCGGGEIARQKDRHRDRGG